MSRHEFSSPKINLSRKPGELPFDVDMEAFFEFSFWMAEELTELIDRHDSREKERRRDQGYRLLADRVGLASTDEFHFEC